MAAAPGPAPQWKDTVPIPYAQCPACRDDYRHVWIEMDADRTGTVTLHRMVCQCDEPVGRCGVRQVRVTPNGRQGHGHGWAEAPSR